jgi:hypothetical protein
MHTNGAVFYFSERCRDWRSEILAQKDLAGPGVDGIDGITLRVDIHDVVLPFALVVALAEGEDVKVIRSLLYSSARDSVRTAGAAGPPCERFLRE